jgi:hypothetical protein
MDYIGEVDGASSSTLTEPLLLIDDDDDDLRLTSFPKPRHGPSRSSESFQLPQDSDHDLVDYDSDSDNNLSCIPRTTCQSLWVIIAVPLIILLVLLFLFASLLPHHP